MSKRQKVTEGSRVLTKILFCFQGIAEEQGGDIMKSQEEIDFHIFKGIGILSCF